MAREEKPYDSDAEMGRPEDENEENGEEEDGDDVEYEIEQILDARHGTFEGGKLGYLVKWKGYGSEDNSWVKEDDAGGAADLIEEYWAKQKKGQARKVPPGRKSVSKAREESSEVETSAAPKRSRAPVSKPILISDDEEEPEPQPKPKKAKTTTATSSVGTKKSSASAKAASVSKPSAKNKKPTREPSSDEEEEVDDYADLRKWKTAESWEHIVDHVDTVERTDEGKLYVYFTLNQKGLTKADTAKCREESSICKEKFPKALLEFYERNLRWRKLDEPDEED